MHTTEHTANILTMSTERAKELDKLQKRIRRGTSTPDDELSHEKLSGKPVSDISKETPSKKKRRLEQSRQQSAKRVKLESTEDRKQRLTSNKIRNKLLRATDLTMTEDEECKLIDDLWALRRQKRPPKLGNRMFKLPSFADVEDNRKKEWLRKQEMRLQAKLQQDKMSFLIVQSKLSTK